MQALPAAPQMEVPVQATRQTAVPRESHGTRLSRMYKRAPTARAARLAVVPLAYTPLHYAAYFGRANYAALFLARGADSAVGPGRALLHRRDAGCRVRVARGAVRRCRAGARRRRRGR